MKQLFNYVRNCELRTANCELFGQCAVQARYVFINSLGQRRELGAQIVRREVEEIRERAEN